MRILFDHGTPAPLIPFLEGHAVTKAKDLGCFLKAAEQAGFEVLLTTDKNMASQQNFEKPDARDCGARKFAMADLDPSSFEKPAAQKSQASAARPTAGQGQTVPLYGQRVYTANRCPEPSRPSSIGTMPTARTSPVITSRPPRQSRSSAALHCRWRPVSGAAKTGIRS